MKLFLTPLKVGIFALQSIKVERLVIQTTKYQED
ncbi:MAG: hypothetical protein RLZZ382_1041 [Bacteroidota bacterium]|jgi:hypothetical protein